MGVTVMGFCSAVTLAFATIFSLVAAALLAIAFSTDNWITINVNRNQLRNKADISDQDLNQSPLYFTRTRGLFRECYLGEKLDDDPENTQVPLAGLVEVYMSPVETWCRNVDYYIPDENDVTKTFNKEQMTRIHMMRAMIALFILDSSSCSSPSRPASEAAGRPPPPTSRPPLSSCSSPASSTRAGWGCGTAWSTGRARRS